MAVLVIKDGYNYYNRFVLVQPNGNISGYNKRHTFTLTGENKVYVSGKEKVIIKFKGWKICPLICYDLRFPVWSRNVEDYHLLIYVANWPKARVDAWDTLLKARAIENMSYCIGVNRVGNDGNKLKYSGNSAAYNALGKRLVYLEEHEEQIKEVELSLKQLKDIRENLKFLNDRDRFILM